MRKNSNSRKTETSLVRSRLMNSLKISYVQDKPSVRASQQRRDSSRYRNNNSPCGRRDGSEMVEYDSVMVRNNRVSKNSRRIDYDNGRPIGLSDLALQNLPSSSSNRNQEKKRLGHNFDRERSVNSSRSNMSMTERKN